MRLAWSPTAAAAASKKRRKLAQLPSCFAREEDEECQEGTAAAVDRRRLSTEKELPGNGSTPTHVGVGVLTSALTSESTDKAAASRQLQTEGNELAQRGEYQSALSKWSTAVALTPDRASLHESQAQVLMELGDTWQAVQAATRATELEPGWAECWTTLARAQLNMGEPQMAYESAAKALKLLPKNAEALEASRTAHQLLTRQRQLEHEEREDAARLAAGGVAASRVTTHRRVRVLEEPGPSSAAAS